MGAIIGCVVLGIFGDAKQQVHRNQLQDEDVKSYQRNLGSSGASKGSKSYSTPEPPSPPYGPSKGYDGRASKSRGKGYGKSVSKEYSYWPGKGKLNPNPPSPPAHPYGQRKGYHVKSGKESSYRREKTGNYSKSNKSYQNSMRSYDYPVKSSKGYSGRSYKSGKGYSAPDRPYGPSKGYSGHSNRSYGYRKSYKKNLKWFYDYFIIFHYSRVERNHSPCYLY